MIAKNIQKIKKQIAAAAIGVDRSPNDIKLIAVSKHCPAEKITEACLAGQRFFGENYIQEIQSKREDIPTSTIFHFIGHLQSNKAKIAAETCDMIETVDRFKLGKILNKHLQLLDKTMNILIQVNVGNDPNKTGLDCNNTEDLLSQLNELPQIRVCGLMTMPPLARDPESSRTHFRNLRLLAEQLAVKGLFPEVETPQLSMGMSNDFHVAIEEGATIVRIGTAIFGQRF